MPVSPSRPPTEKPAIAKERVHFVGIGGIGLSAIARILLAWGTRVSGSDLNLTKVTDDLVALGARIAEGHAESNVGDATLLVMSSAIPESNPEIQAARRSGIPVLKRADFIGEMMAGKLGIAVAGTHGKTTTTAMIAHLLAEAELDPSFIVGGIPSGLGTNARAGQGDHFVIEADEYDGMFLGLRPRIAVVTHLERDHPDCYPTLAHMKDAFRRFLRLVPTDGSIVACLDEPNVRDLMNEFHGSPRVIGYGIGAYLADEPPLPRHRVVHLLLAVLSVYNQYYAGLLLVGNFVALLLLRQPPRLLLRYLLDMAGVALALIPLVAMLSRQLGAYDAIAGDTGLGLALKSAYWRAADLLLPCAESPLLGPRKWILRALLLLALLGGLRARRRLAGQPGLLALLATSGMSLLMLAALTMKLGNEMVDFRHTAFLLAPLLLAALGLARAALGGRAVAGYALLVILFSLISLAYTYRPMAKTGDWQRLAGYLAAQESAGQPILFYKAGAVLAFRAYYRGINPVHPLPAEPKLDQWNPTSDILTGEAEVRRRIDSLRGGGAERFWLVMDDARQYSGITYSHAMLERLTAACCERVKGQRFYRGQATLFRWRAP